METVPDTLVLKIDEYDNDTDVKKLDTTIYILYDIRSRRYVIRGKRNHHTHKPYSYECETVNNLVDFLLFLFGQNNTFSYILYNYDNLPENSNEITFEFLEEYKNTDSKVVSYNVITLIRSDIKKILKILKNVFND